MTSTKNAELGGSNAVNPTPIKEWKNDQTKDVRASALSGCLGSKGAGDAIAGYKDNDITANLVNAKHTNPGIGNA